MRGDNIASIQGINGKEIHVFDANYDNSQMDQKGFLKVLLANFKYQDPFQMQDIGKFIDNTLKLRELEVMNAFENSVKNFNDPTQMLIEASNMIGKKVVYSGNATYIENGKSYIDFTLKEPASIATVYIYDKDENIVDKQSFQNLQAGKIYPFEIDNPKIADGYYRVSIVAKEANKEVPIDMQHATALVTGIQRGSEGIDVLYENGAIAIKDIMKVGG